LRVRIGRLAAVPVALLVTSLLIGAIGVGPTIAGGPPGLGRFMYAVGQVESHGNYEARNPVSGAYGKYQFMPASWRAWAKRYLGDANAKPTPRNQEIVAAGKMTALYKWLGQWRRVAYWWLTGSSRTAGWSKNATRYVNRVMKIYDATPVAPTPPPTPKAKPTPRPTPKPTPKPKPTPTPKPVAPVVRHIPDSGPGIAYTGVWRAARHPAYAGASVRYAITSGARATFSFDGHAVSWSGPVGPTRGRARVYVDGKLATTVDLFATTFSPRRTVWSRSWPANGRHTIAIEVAGTRGRPFVAIDEFMTVQ
jgi:transglycosylase-like protein